MAKRGGKDGFMNFENVQDYIEENTRIEALQFYRLDYLFRLFITLVSLLLCLNLMHYFLFEGLSICMSF